MVFRKVDPAFFLVAGAALTFVGLGLYAWQRYGPQPAPEPASAEEVRAFFAESDTFQEERSRKFVSKFDGDIANWRPPPDVLAVEDFRRVFVPVATPWSFEGIDFASGMATSLLFELPSGPILLPDFEPYNWSPGIFDTDLFSPNSGTAVAWQDAGERVGLWLHSGYDQTASPIQRYLELSEDGYRVPYQIAEVRLSESVLGSKVHIQQPNLIGTGQVAAVVRVPPEAVPEVTTHVMDLVEYLAET